MLELHAYQRLGVGGGGEIGHAGAEPPAVGPRAGGQAARGARAELHGSHGRAGILGRVDMRHLHAHHAAVHQAGCRWGVGLRPADRRDADRVAGHRHQLHVGRADAAVLAIDQHPVEAGKSQHLDHLRRGKHHRAAERRLAACDLLLHAVGLHSAALLCGTGIGGAALNPRARDAAYRGRQPAPVPMPTKASASGRSPHHR